VNVFRLTRLSAHSAAKTLWSFLDTIRGRINKECKTKQSDPLSQSVVKLILRAVDEVERSLAVASATRVQEFDEAVVGKKRGSVVGGSGKTEADASDLDSQCPMCSRYYPKRTIEQHVQICLHAKDDQDENDEIKRQASGGDDDSSSGTGKDEAKKSEGKVECPMCGKGFPLSDIESHAAVCVESTQLEADAKLARALSDGSHSGGSAAAAAAAESTEKKSSPLLASKSKVATKSAKGASGSASAIDKNAFSAKTKAILERIEREEKERTATLANGDKECPICQFGTSSSAYDSHVSTCWKCTICFRAHKRAELAEHVSSCAKQGGIDEEEQVNTHFARKEQGLLNAMQLSAVQWVQKQAQRMTEEKHPMVVDKFTRLGFSEEDLKSVNRFIRNEAPIIVHVQLDECLKFLLKDTHYRNQFETNTSHGTLSHSTRTGWEDRMFNRIYHDAPGFQRVKYGVLNMSNSPSGVRACKAYGDSYLLLNQNVRLRTTFANMDTGCDQASFSSDKFVPLVVYYI
jgi:hypothetical protein